jgi:hypothetical protein
MTSFVLCLNPKLASIVRYGRLPQSIFTCSHEMYNSVIRCVVMRISRSSTYTNTWIWKNRLTVLYIWDQHKLRHSPYWDHYFQNKLWNTQYSDHNCRSLTLKICLDKQMVDAWKETEREKEIRSQSYTEKVIEFSMNQMKIIQSCLMWTWKIWPQNGVVVH